MKRCNMFAKFNERRKENSQISKGSPGPGCQMCGFLGRSSLLWRRFPRILHLGKGVGCTQDLCAGFCFHFDLFIIRL